MDRRLFLRSATAAGIAATFTNQMALASQFSALTQISSNVAAVTGDNVAITLEKVAVQELADSLHGDRMKV